MMRLRLAMFALCACLIAAATPAQGIQLPEVHRVELDHGVVLLLIEKRDVPLIGFGKRGGIALACAHLQHAREQARQTGLVGRVGDGAAPNDSLEAD